MRFVLESSVKGDPEEECTHTTLEGATSERTEHTPALQRHDLTLGTRLPQEIKPGVKETLGKTKSRLVAAECHNCTVVRRTTVESLIMHIDGGPTFLPRSYAL